MMRNLLARANREVLEQFACSRTLLAFDFDGTLSPIVRDPDAATMRPSTRRLLLQVARAYPCVVISGRARDDVRRRVRGIALREVIGNHGLEPGRAGVPARRVVRRWMPLLEQRLGTLPGVAVEDKGFSLAVHYRRSREKKRARARILAAAATLGEVRLMRGKQVLNLLPAGAPHKGVALEQARARLGCDTAVYVGDDETDEDVFALDQPGQLLAVRVGPKKSSSAAYYIRTQAEIDRLLGSLLAFRPRRGEGRAITVRA
jgi:trehalose 6-phosphate phosphatase